MYLKYFHRRSLIGQMSGCLSKDFWTFFCTVFIHRWWNVLWRRWQTCCRGPAPCLSVRSVWSCWRLVSKSHRKTTGKWHLIKCLYSVLRYDTAHIFCVVCQQFLLCYNHPHQLGNSFIIKCHNVFEQMHQRLSTVEIFSIYAHSILGNNRHLLHVSFHVTKLQTLNTILCHLSELQPLKSIMSSRHR